MRKSLASIVIVVASVSTCGLAFAEEPKRPPRPASQPPPPPALDREMRSITQELKELGPKRDEMARKVGPNHREVHELGKRIEQLERRLMELRGEMPRGERHVAVAAGPWSAGARTRRPPLPELMKKLEAPLKEVKFENVQFGQVIEFLREQQGGINISVDWKALANCDIDKETPVTLDQLLDVPFGQVLQRVLEGISPPGPRPPLDFYVDGNVVVVTTSDRMAPPGPPPVPVEEVLERLRHDRPELHDRLMMLRRENPERFREELPRFIQGPPPIHGEAGVVELGPHPVQVPLPPGMGPVTAGVGVMGETFNIPVPPPMGPERRRIEMQEMRERDPERFKLMQRDEQLTDRTIELAEKCRRPAEPEARKRAETELREVLSQQFDVRMEIRRMEVKDLRARLDELTAGLEKRIKEKPALIERRVKQLLNPDEAEW
jgi:hypothetical protein